MLDGTSVIYCKKCGFTASPGEVVINIHCQKCDNKWMLYHVEDTSCDILNDQAVADRIAEEQE